MYVMFCDINCIIRVKIDLYSFKLMKYLCKNVMYGIIYVIICMWDFVYWRYGEYSLFFF